MEDANEDDPGDNDGGQFFGTLKQILQQLLLVLGILFGSELIVFCLDSFITFFSYMYCLACLFDGVLLLYFCMVRVVWWTHGLSLDFNPYLIQIDCLLTINLLVVKGVFLNFVSSRAYDRWLSYLGGKNRIGCRRSVLLSDCMCLGFDFWLGFNLDCVLFVNFAVLHEISLLKRNKKTL